MYDGTGAQVASLAYDAYGNTVSVTNPNGLYIPFRYRGYYFDEETGFYYLQSRYYDPETGRFINADDVGYLGKSNYLNLFAYCGNNPVMFTDPTGKYIAISYDRIWPETIFRLDYHQFDTWLKKISNHIYNKESSGFWAFLGLTASYIDCAVVQVGLFAVDAVTNIVTGYYDELESVRHHGDNLRYDSKTRYDNYGCFHYDLNFYISFLDGYHGWEIKMSSYIGRMHLQTYIFNIRWGGAYLDMLEFMLEIKECDATLYYDMRFSYFMEKRL